jgi:hypothetical protein
MADVRSQPTLGDYLVREGIITQAQLNQALEEQLSTSRSIGRILVEMGFITESARMTLLQKRFGFELIRLKDTRIDPGVLTMIPYSFAEKHRIVPIRKESELSLIVAMEDPSDILIIDAVKNQIGLRIKPVVASQEDIQNVLNQYSTITQEEAVKAEIIKRAKQPGLLHKIFQYGAFPVLAIAPLVLFFVFLSFDFLGISRQFQTWQTEGNLTLYDRVLYILLSWGTWTMILFEINGLIFDRKKEEDE